jgi:putative glutamine amidotransferase
MTADIPNKPRVGIPWRTSQEESQQQMEKLRHYFDRVREAGGEPVHISLLHSGNELEERLRDLDGFVLPGSPADVDPTLYGAARHPKTVTLDANRDRTDLAILEHSVRNEKPVFAICYGCQVLNVFCGGTLVQDLASEKAGSIRHGKTDLAPGVGTGDLQHAASLAEGSRLEKLAGTARVTINTSHHQAIDQPGKNLAVTCRAEDGVIEGVEWTGGKNWILGAQWHPERMPEDSFARKLFQDFVSAAVARSHVAVGQKS